METRSDIYQLIESSDDNLKEISAWLDCLPPEAVYSALNKLNRQQQRTLFGKAAAAEPLTLSYFVSESVPEGKTVRHLGRNTLPLFGKGKVFEKRMCQSPEDSTHLYGYNHTSYMSWFGPGYFVARETPEYLDWRQRGAVVIDYFMQPPGPFPNDWPAYRPNYWPPQSLFYYHTRDFMRRVSQRVSIGVAYRNEKCLEHYFILVRQD